MKLRKRILVVKRKYKNFIKIIFIKRTPFVVLRCLWCRKLFKFQLRESRHRIGKLCSFKCTGEYLGRKNRKKKRCLCCKRKFITKKKNQKYCGRECKDLGQRSKDPKSYRGKALKKFGKRCRRCGYKQCIRALNVHHKDRNRKNNKLKNLVVLCMNCHAEVHDEQRKGIRSRWCR